MFLNKFYDLIIDPHMPDETQAIYTQSLITSSNTDLTGIQLSHHMKTECAKTLLSYTNDSVIYSLVIKMLEYYSLYIQQPEY